MKIIIRRQVSAIRQVYGWRGETGGSLELGRFSMGVRVSLLFFTKFSLIFQLFFSIKSSSYTSLSELEAPEASFSFTGFQESRYCLLDRLHFFFFFFFEVFHV